MLLLFKHFHWHPLLKNRLIHSMDVHWQTLPVLQLNVPHYGDHQCWCWWCHNARINVKVKLKNKIKFQLWQGREKSLEKLFIEAWQWEKK